MVALERTAMTEPAIVINSHRLTEAQAMAVRVAVSSFWKEMDAPDALGDDRAGRDLAWAYRDRLAEVIKIMHRQGP